MCYNISTPSDILIRNCLHLMGGVPFFCFVKMSGPYLETRRQFFLSPIKESLFCPQGAEFNVNGVGSHHHMMESNGMADQQIVVKRPKGPVLRIEKVRKEDAGTYICTASNNVGTMSADQIELRVLCKQRLISFSPPVP